MVGLILIVTAKTKLRHFRDKVFVNVGTMRIVASRALTFLDGTVNCFDAIGHHLVVTTDTERFRGKLQESGILCLMRTVTKRAKSHIRGSMFMFSLCEFGVTGVAQLTAVGRETKFVSVGVLVDMARIAGSLIRICVVRARA
jgi:hypothetical protein